MAAWAAIAGAIGSSVAGGVANYYSQQNADEASMERQREANEFSAAEAEKNRQFNAAEAEKNRQFQRQSELDARAYNSPARQMERMRAAGINPYVAMDNIHSGEASSLSGSSASSGASPSSAAPIQKQPFDYGSVIQQGFADYVQLQSLQSQLDKEKAERDLITEQGISQQIKNDYERSNQIIAIASQLEGIREAKSRVKVNSQQYKNLGLVEKELKSNLNVLTATEEERKKTPKIQNDLNVEQTGYYAMMTKLQDANIRLSKTQQVALYQGIKESAQRIENLKADKKLTEAQENKVIAEEAKTNAEKVGIDNNNKQFKTLSRLNERLIESEINRNNTRTVYGVPFERDEDNGVLYRNPFNTRIGNF